MSLEPTIIDRVAAFISPAWGLSRLRARAQEQLFVRHWEGAAAGRRTAGWRAPVGDSNTVDGPALDRLRAVARDLVRNNPHADNAVDTIADHVVGWGIVPKPLPMSKQALAIWQEWAYSTSCDADGRLDFNGIQKLTMRTVVEAGECLIRKRVRLPGDGLPLPLQLQVLEPDYLDTLKTGITLPNGGRIINGVEFDVLGRRAAYWLFPEHPGATIFGNALTSRRVPADGVLHIYRQTRAGQVRGPSWFGPVLLKLKDFDEYDDAQLMKQKIAALLAGIVTDANGGGTIVGTTEPGAEFPSLFPGALIQAPVGTDVKFTDPPRTNEYKDYATVTLRAIATGLGTTYEDLTGDYSQVNFSSARMSRLSHYEKVYDWRWMMLVPQLCNPVWAWAMEAASILSMVRGDAPKALWTAPPIPMIEPDKEGLAYQRNIRSGLQSLSESLRERGYDPDEVMAEMASDQEKLDKLGLVLDSDPRRMTQAGQAQPPPPAEAPPTPPAGQEPTPAEGRLLKVSQTALEVAGAAVDTARLAAERPINVDARTTIQPGAVQISSPVTVQPPAINIARGAVRVIQKSLPFLPETAEEPADELGDGLTEKQRVVLGALRGYHQEVGEAPTLSLLARKLGLTRKTIQGHLDALHRKGRLKTPTPSGLPA